MRKFKVRYTIENDVYESEVGAASSGSAMRWITVNYPTAKHIQIVG